MNRIAVIDSDAIKLMGLKIEEDDTSHLGVILKYFDESFIHQFVYDKETHQQHLIDHIDELKNLKLLEIWSDNDILNLLDAQLQNQAASCSLYITYLQQALGGLKLNNPLYTIFDTIFNKSYTTINQLVLDLTTCDNFIPTGTGAGEIKTLILTQALAFTGYSQINLFLSNDIRARNLMVNQTGSTVEGCSPIASFLLLKEAGVSKSDAAKYFSTYTPSWQIKVKRNNHSKETKTYQELFDDIYDQDVKIEITVAGLLNYT